MDLKTKISETIFQTPIMNASGPLCSDEEQLFNLVNSSSSATVSKSCTILEREGNPKPRYYDNSSLSINSMGLPNKGYQFYIDMIDKINNHYVENPDMNCKPYIISLAGLSLNDNIKIINKINRKMSSYENYFFGKKNKLKVGIEINLSCPNIIGKGQLAYDFNNMKEYLDELFLKISFKYISIIGIKLPPYFELHHFKIVANIIKQFPFNFITTINSIPNGLVIDHEKECAVITPKQGLGGLGGSIVNLPLWPMYLIFAKNLRILISVLLVVVE